MPRHSRVKSNTNGKFISSVTFNGFGVNSIYPNIIENTTGAIGNVIGSFGSRAIRYYDFYQKEKTGGKLDIKNNWNSLFDSSTLNVPSFIYDGDVINAGELGNIAYGYWGKSLEFTDDELFYDGGVARMLVDRNYDNIWNSFITDKYYGDRPEDIEDIMKGIALYNKLHFNMGCGGAR